MSSFWYLADYKHKPLSPPSVCLSEWHVHSILLEMWHSRWVWGRTRWLLWVETETLPHALLLLFTVITINLSLYSENTDKHFIRIITTNSKHFIKSWVYEYECITTFLLYSIIITAISTNNNHFIMTINVKYYNGKWRIYILIYRKCSPMCVTFTDSHTDGGFTTTQWHIRSPVLTFHLQGLP